MILSRAEQSKGVESAVYRFGRTEIQRKIHIFVSPCTSIGLGMCEVLNETTLDGASKTSEWLMKNNFAANCSDQNSTSSEETAVASAPVGKLRSPNRTILKATLYESASRKHRRHKRRSTKRHHDHIAGNTERFNNTAEILRRSGLLEITQSISRLVNDNKKLQNEIDKLEQETKEHSKQLQRQLQKKLEAESEARGSCNPEGHKLLTKLSQSLLHWKD